MNKFLKTFALTFIFFLGITLNVSAKTNVKCIDQLIIDGTSELELYDEVIDVDVANGLVSHVYEIYNPLDDTVKVKGLYPVRYYESHSYDNCNISNFFAFDENDLLKSYQVQSEKYEIRNYCAFDFQIDAKQIKHIKITYNANFAQETDYSLNIEAYRLENTNFKNNIKHTKISFDFGEITKYYVITPNDNSTYKKVENKYVWEANNYKPKENLSLLVRPKLLISNTLNVSYYTNTSALKNKTILIDVDSLYTKTEAEKEAVLRASELLKTKLEQSGAEVAVSNDIETFEKKIKKEANFDYIITLICKSSLDPNLITKEIFVEPLKRGNEEKYIKSELMASYIQNAGLSGITEYFKYLRDKKLTGKNVLRYVGSLDVSQTEYNKVPRIIISLGYISDTNKTYESFEGIIEKTRLGICIMEECEKEDSKQEFIITKNNYKIVNSEKNFFARMKSKISKFFKYNAITILSSIMIGIGISIVIFVMISSHYDKKIKISYDDLKQKEKELENKMTLIEKEKIQSEKHKETLKEIIKERLNLIKEKRGTTSGLEIEETDFSQDNNEEKETKNNYIEELKNLASQMKIEIKNPVVKDANNNDLINDEELKRKQKEEFKNKKDVLFKKLLENAKVNRQKMIDSNLNSFSKLNKKQAKKIITKIKIKGIGK